MSRTTGIIKGAYGVTLAAVVLATGACSTGAKQAPANLDGLPAGNAATSATSGATAAGKSSSSAGATSASTPASASSAAASAKFVSGAATPDLAITGWMTDVLKGDYVAACGYMGKAAKGSTPGVAATQDKCAQIPTTPAMLSMLTGLHKTFTPAGGAAPAVTVAGIKPSGTSATVTDTQVKLGGKLLRDVIIANSKGIPAGKSTTTFALAQVDKLWYVVDIAIKT